MQYNPTSTTIILCSRAQCKQRWGWMAVGYLRLDAFWKLLCLLFYDVHKIADPFGAAENKLIQLSLGHCSPNSWVGGLRYFGRFVDVNRA